MCPNLLVFQETEVFLQNTVILKVHSTHIDTVQQKESPRRGFPVAHNQGTHSWGTGLWSPGRLHSGLLLSCGDHRPQVPVQTAEASPRLIRSVWS